VSFKAVLYALVGIINTAVDFTVFLAADALGSGICRPSAENGRLGSSTWPPN
jgi:putative flippase GtrA